MTPLIHTEYFNNPDAKPSNDWASREDISLPDIWRAIATVGEEGPYAAMPDTWRSVARQLGLAMLATSYLERDHNGWIVSQEYRLQARSDKVCSSYWLGNAFTKLIAERRLGLPWLAHIERVDAQNNITLQEPSSRSRPDWVSLDKDDNWYVFESKGRSSKRNGGLVKEAKKQAGQIDTINGSVPVLRAVCASYLYENPIYVSLTDPDEKGKVKVKINTEEYFRKYYGAFVSLLNLNPILYKTYDGVEFAITSRICEDLKMTIGIAQSLLQNPKEALKITIEFPDFKHWQGDEYISIGADGVLFGFGPASNQDLYDKIINLLLSRIKKV